jgi:hypothetical protein
MSEEEKETIEDKPQYRWEIGPNLALALVRLGAIIALFVIIAAR